MLRRPLRNAALAALLVALGLSFVGTASGKSFSLPQASVVVAVQPDGSLTVEELITFVFDGSFSGAYRDIPLRQGEIVRDAFVEETRSALYARRIGRAGKLRRSRHLRDDRHRRWFPHRLALQRLLRAP